MKTKQGEISVFLSLILVCVLSLFLGLMESARMAGARLYLEMAVDSSMSSVMSQYNRNLWDMYHLLFLEAESDEAIEESFASYLGFYLDQDNLYPMQIKEVDVKETENMPDDGGKPLEKEILSYVSYQFPEILKGLPNIEILLESIQDMDHKKPDWDVANEYIDEAMNLKQEEIEIDWEKIKLLDRLKELFQGDLLDLVLEEEIPVSTKSVGLKGIPSTEYRGAKLKENSIAEKYMISEYCRLNFDSFLTHCERNLAPRQQVLQYEQEYLLFGKESDRKNLKEAVERLLALRSAWNLSYLLQSAKCRSEVDLFTMTISGGNIYIQGALSAFILSLWAFAEAVWDVKILLNGETVPLFKGADQWNLGLESFLNLRFLDKPPKKEMTGADYDDYLRILFLMADRTERNTRIMDVIQWNMQSVQEDFLVRDCISKVEIQTAVEGTHLFLKHGTYAKATNVGGHY